MEKNAIKKFAVWAREELIKRCSTKAEEYGITQDSVADAGAVSINGKLLTEAQIKQRKALIEKIKKDGYEQAIEEVAYTWFNRFAALRFMEVNEVLPSRVRVFTDKDGAFHPQILAEALSMDLRGLDKEKVISLIEDNKTEELYKYLLITQCNDLSYILPGLFQRIDDYTELLFPDNLLRKDSVIDRMVRQGQSDSIPEADWKDQVQIIGWLYQYYNSVPKDIVFANLKKNIKVGKEDIPAATQLFTPDWIVRYMVENSLGRSVINNLTYDIWADDEKAKIDRLKSEWRYYLDEAPQDEKVEAELRMLEHHKYGSGNTQPFVDTTLIDPCMGSGHVLVYAFDVFMQIYRVQGWSDRDAVRRIIEKNLFGLDIDERAAQLAYFAVMMKACQYDKRFLTRKDAEGNPNLPQPNIYSIPESGYFDTEGKRKATIDPAAIEFFVDGRSEIKVNLEKILEQMFNAKEYGSALQIEGVDFDALYARYDETFDEISLYRQVLDTELLPLLRVAEMLSRQYDCVVTNPPYMGSGNMESNLADFLKRIYPDSKSDLSTVFMEKALSLCKIDGYMAMINIPVWMFLSSYEKLREKIISQNTFISMVHPGRGIFGSDFGTTTFVIAKRHINNYIGQYRRLFDKQGEVESIEQREMTFFENKGRFTANQSNFSKIPGSPIAYWVSGAMLRVFDGTKVADVAETCMGLTTGDNGKFLRLWFEVSYRNIKFNANNAFEANNSKAKWFPYHKGGEFRRWYGNNDYVVNWEHDGQALRAFSGSTIRNTSFYFRRGITWSLITSSIISFRYRPIGFIFGDAGPAVFPKSIDFNVLFGLLNTKIIQAASAIINPTINSSSGVVASFPVMTDVSESSSINSKVDECIAISKADWDSFETSWDFQSHPLAPMTFERKEQLAAGMNTEERKKAVTLLSERFKRWERDCNDRFAELKVNEEELNRIFIDIYGLQDELTPEVEDKDVTV